MDLTSARVKQSNVHTALFYARKSQKLTFCAESFPFDARCRSTWNKFVLIICQSTEEV